MKSWKTKLIGTFVTLGLLVSLISLMVMPAAASPGNVLYFDPDPAGVPECCQTVEVTIMAESDVALTATLLTFTFDNTCLNVVDAVGNLDDWYAVTIQDLDVSLDEVDCDSINEAGEMVISTTVGLSPALEAGTYEIATVWLHCINCDGCTSALHWTVGEYTDDMFMTIYPDLDDGAFTCGGKELVSGLPGQVPKDDFLPGEDVYVWGTGFMAGMEYMIYIQPYVPNTEVYEGQPLDAGAGAPLGYMTPLVVVANADGTIDPQYLFTAAPEHICMYWEIVADAMGAGYPGIYNAADDGLDAVALEDYGFHVIPEALTIILLGGGLAGLGGYVAARRRRNK